MSTLEEIKQERIIRWASLPFEDFTEAYSEAARAYNANDDEDIERPLEAAYDMLVSIGHYKWGSRFIDWCNHEEVP